MAAHTGMGLYRRDGHAIAICDGTARTGLWRQPSRCAMGQHENNDAADDVLYGGAGNDALYAPTRDRLDI